MPPRKSSTKKAKELDIPGQSTYPGKRDGKGLEQPQWEACRSMLERVYHSVDGGRLVAEIFCELPDREDYVDYYKTIPEPECLDNVATLLSDQTYISPDQFFGQLELVFLNAKYYNEEGSQVWDDAKTLEDQIHAEWKAFAQAGIFKSSTPQMQKSAGGKRNRRAKSGSERATSHPRTSATPVPGPSTMKPAEKPQLASVPETPPPIPVAPKHPPSRAFNAADQASIEAVEVRLPRWPGPQLRLDPPNVYGINGSGWWGEGAPEYEQSVGGSSAAPQRIQAVLKTLTSYKDGALAQVISRVPVLVDDSTLSFKDALSLAMIKEKAAQGGYNLATFDLDMARLFEKSRKWYAEGSTEYGQVLECQRLYQASTAPYPPRITGPSPSLFASIPAGPGRARPLSEDTGFGVTSTKVSAKDRTYTSEARYKGQAYRVGDFVHLINPDDATRPIIGQVFKTFLPTKSPRSHHATICWYYRPEQTVHTADRQFYDREVLKTGHFVDHPVEDILERIAVQFFVKYVRGRPKTGEYYPGWPLYVCQSRFNDRAWVTIRIKNWASCIPEELRQSDFMSTIPFDRVLEPISYPSPLLNGLKSTGFIAEPRAQVTDDDDEEKPARPSPLPQPAPKPVASTPHHVPPAAETTSSRAVNAAPHVSTSALPSAPPLPPASTRTFGAMYGGQQAMDQLAYKDYLPIDIVRLFDRDARQSVLWFSGPPIPHPLEKQPLHSLEYLAHVAKRRKV